MFGMMKSENVTPSEIVEPGYRFAQAGTLLFLNGAPLSGKSTVAPLLAASISGCMIQNIDIIRLAAQEIDRKLPEAERDPVLNYGSCDSYLAIDDGSYSPTSLVKGYRRYADATCRILHYIIPRLEVQGTSDVLFEGVQLLPSVIGQYLDDKNKMITVTSEPKKLLDNRTKLFGEGPNELTDRYDVDRLMLVQAEILNQTAQLPSEQIFRADNTSRYTDTVRSIMRFLQDSGTIIPNV